RGIGRFLADQVRRGVPVASWQVKYTAIHAVDKAEPSKLDADIISLDKEARVDHIDNVRRVVAAYLESLYGYPRGDSDLLALFVSYYNAVYRSNLPYFSGKYKNLVLSYLTKDKVGISLRYYEWPGSTQLVIPLNEKEKRDVLGSLSSTELTSKGVMDQLKQKEDKGLPERKAMVELKQKEVEKGRSVVDQEAKKLSEERQKTAEKTTAVETARQKVEQAKTPEEKKAAEEQLAAKQAELTTQQGSQAAAEQKVATSQTTVEQKQAEVTQEKKEITADEAAQKIAQNPEQAKKELEQKTAELAQKEQDLAKREEALRQGQTDSAIFKGKLYYLKIKEYLMNGHYNNDMLIINAANGQVLLKATDALICGRRFDLFKNGVVVITYKTNHSEGHYLTLLDLDTLKRKAISDQAVFFRSFVETRESLTYVIVDKGDGYYLGKFDTDMKMVALSKDKVDPDSFISFYQDLVYINGSDKNILVLNKADLTTSVTVAP
ncbi:MAG TPA: P83/100 family protein, partial [Conexivisphaerales archaeon]|nr:P83/100 family protein [Conexivisphaerales archaeon]